jgi:16S rRNA (uracil1498-N3)-methyltransferase
MRLRELDRIVAFDGTGREYVGFIREVKRGSVSIQIVETRTPSGPQAAKLTLIQAIPKKDRMDYIVEKATELGAHSIVPVFTKRTIAKWDERKRADAAGRWRRIAKEASKQSGRTDIPAVSDVRTFTEALKGSADYDYGLIATLHGETVRIKDALAPFKGGRIAVAIGPEGDFTPDEVNKAREAGFKAVSLGPTVLKSDTAGLAALAALNYEFSGR